MAVIQTLLAQMRDAWAQRWESIESALAGVTPEEADYQAPCYRDEPPEEGWPPPGTIRWQVAHLTRCKRHFGECVRRRGRGPAPEPGPRTPTASFERELAELRAAHEAQCAAIAECADADLGLPTGHGSTLEGFLAMSVRHDVWHAAQIVVARRLWRTRG